MPVRRVLVGWSRCGTGTDSNTYTGRDGFGLDLRAQPTDVDVDRARVTVVAVAPRSVEQLAPGPRASRVAGQDGEQVEFPSAADGRAAVPPQLVGEEIELAGCSAIVNEGLSPKST